VVTIFACKDSENLPKGQILSLLFLLTAPTFLGKSQKLCNFAAENNQQQEAEMRKLIWLTAMLLAVAGMQAAPALRGVWKLLTLTDGTTVRAELQGDEHLRYWRSDDGRTFIAEGDAYVENVLTEARSGATKVELVLDDDDEDEDL
jgi:hypothetical protein